jgi:hypothetical protein
VQGAAKGQRRYRYYVSRALVRGDSEGTKQGWRISAPEIEQRVAASAQAVLGDRLAIALALEASGVDPNRLQSVLKSAHAWSERLASSSAAAAALGQLIERVLLSRESIHVSLKLPPGAMEDGDQ